MENNLKLYLIAFLSQGIIKYLGKDHDITYNYT
nr:MAG TPA: hypothetical protein [Bacteriophage sp.]